MKRVVNIGSCRQNSLNHYFTVFNVNDLISYPHYSKEVLELINFCKYGNLIPDETLYMFRSPMLNKKPIIFNKNIQNTFLEGDIYVIEIASNKTYEYNNKYLHHIAINTALPVSMRDKITSRIQTNEEIEYDIIEIKTLLKKPLVIISHLVTFNNGSTRYLLSNFLEEICEKHCITYINPVKELIKNNCDITKCFVKEDKLAHYTDYGNKEIGKIYYNIINSIKL